MLRPATCCASSGRRIRSSLSVKLAGRGTACPSLRRAPEPACPVRNRCMACCRRRQACRYSVSPKIFGPFFRSVLRLHATVRHRPIACVRMAGSVRPFFILGRAPVLPLHKSGSRFVRRRAECRVSTVRVGGLLRRRVRPCPPAVERPSRAKRFPEHKTGRGVPSESPSPRSGMSCRAETVGTGRF